MTLVDQGNFPKKRKDTKASHWEHTQVRTAGGDVHWNSKLMTCTEHHHCYNQTACGCTLLCWSPSAFMTAILELSWEHKLEHGLSSQTPERVGTCWDWLELFLLLDQDSKWVSSDSDLVLKSDPTPRLIIVCNLIDIARPPATEVMIAVLLLLIFILFYELISISRVQPQKWNLQPLLPSSSRFLLQKPILHHWEKKKKKALTVLLCVFNAMFLYIRTSTFRKIKCKKRENLANLNLKWKSLYY